MVVSRQFNYNISVRGYSIFNNKKASKIKACGVSQTPKKYIYREGAENIPAMLEKMHNKSKSVHDFCVGVDQKLLTDKKLNANYYRKIHFTEREKAVLTFVIEGASNIEIAKCLGISAGRVRNIVADLMTKCMVKNRTQLAVLAVRLGLLES